MKDIKSLASKYLPEAESFLTGIIGIPSVSGENEEEVQEYIRRKFESFGTPELKEIPDGLKKDPEYTSGSREFDYSKRKNLVLHFPSGSGGQSLIVNSHSDTVGFENWPDACRPGKNGTVITGRGACDAKGQVAVIYLALLILSDLKVRPGGKLTVEIVIEEEVGGNGALSLIRQGFIADGAIILEPTELKICPANRGAVWFYLEIEGKPVHMGRIWEGVNAIEKTCFVMKKMREYEKKLIEESRNVPLFESYKQPVQVNFGVIKGGGWPSMVCGKVALEGGVGFLPNKNLGAIKEEIENVIRNCGDDWINSHYKLSFPKLHNDAYAIDRHHGLVTAMESAAGKIRIERCCRWFYSQLRRKTFQQGRENARSRFRTRESG